MQVLARVIATAVIAALAPAVAPSHAGAAHAHPPVAAFYYPWYGTPRLDGGWGHWRQLAARPPGTIASAFWPARGLYSSLDRLVLGAQMDDLRAAGVDVVVSSWWGRGSREDARLPAVAAAARRAGLRVAAHVEPYGGRTPESVVRDVAYLRRFGVRDVYVFAPELSAASEWAGALPRVDSTRVWAQTRFPEFAREGRFDGLYTYDVRAYGAALFDRLCRQARHAGVLCAPSVGPGFDARRATGEPRVKPRRNGLTYDTMWRAAIRARPDAVTLTSYNEWLEGTQIEPARRHVGARGRRFRGYDGAWGRRGRAAERAYLVRTAYWTSRLRAAQYSAVASRRR